MSNNVTLQASPVALERKKRQRKTNYGLTKRVRLALDYLVWGYDLDTVDIKRAGELAGITERAIREALTKPNVLKYYREQMQSLREGQRGNNLRTAIQIRDDAALKKSPTGQRVRLAAAAMLDQDLYTATPSGPGSGNSITVNVVTPGYVIDLREGPTGGNQIDHLDEHVVKPLISRDSVPE